MPVKPAFTVYMLKCADGTLYAGSTGNLEKRLHAHNHLKSGARYTKARRPVKLVYTKSCKTFRRARQEEYRIKCLTRAQKLEMAGDFRRKNRLKGKSAL